MSYEFTAEQMPGPTDAAKQLQLKQWQACDAMYDAWSEASQRLGRNESRTDPGFLAKKAEYDETVAQLQALLGPQAHCCEVDTDLWSIFSDCFKSDNNFRPRFHQTRQQAIEYLGRPSQALSA